MKVKDGLLNKLRNKRLQLGIDPGRHTGIAIANERGELIELLTFDKLHRALWFVFKLARRNKLQVVIEDARLWKVHYAKNWNSGRLQGAGSVKRDSQIWIDFLTDLNIDFQTVAPNKRRNALASDVSQFKKLTGWSKRSSEHARDAAMLIFQRQFKNFQL